jgi:hypothetical protein
MLFSKVNFLTALLLHGNTTAGNGLQKRGKFTCLIAIFQYLERNQPYCLKKTASILLLLALVFNWCGYQLLFSWLQYKASEQLEVWLDNSQYNEEELVEIRVPLGLPYQTDWDDFERVDGEIQLKGVHYKYVKRKVKNGELVLKCILNLSKQQVLNARDVFFKLVNDLDQLTASKKRHKQPGKATLKINIGDYEQYSFFPNLNCVAATKIACLPFAHNGYFNGFHPQKPEQPPEFFSLFTIL